MEDRREYQRYKIDQAQACIIQHQKTVGTILDISAGGLSCVCLDQGDCSKGLSTTVNIYCRKNATCAKDIKMKVLSTEKMKGQFLNDLGLRKCRAKFLGLDSPQRKQLADLVVNTALA